MNTTDTVREKYAAVARGDLSSRDAGVRAVAQAFGYSPDELAAIPAEANMGLSCGNPIAIANLREGETVVDLGCGGGIDVFLASAKVGPTGRAIGIDMTPDMIERAKQNALRGRDGRPFENVEFHLATIDSLPLAGASVDCVISNCVINLAPDKSAVFREIARPQARRPARDQRHRAEARTPFGDRKRRDGVRWLHRWRPAHRGLRTATQISGIRGRRNR